MTFIDYSKISASRAYNKSSKPIVQTKTFKSIDWAEAYKIYVEGSDEWEALATQALHDNEDAKYEMALAKREQEHHYVDSESGAYEGNFRDEMPQQPYPELANKAAGRRKAGLSALENKFLVWGDLSTTVLPDMITYLGQLRVKKNENGLYSGKQFVMDNFKTDWEKGIYVFLMVDNRGSYLGTQYKHPSREYSKLVPLVMYAQRLVNGIKYSEWDPAEISLIVNRELAEAMLFRPETVPSYDEVMAGRLTGLTYASGANVGKVRSAITTHQLYTTSGTCFQGVPKLTQVMWSQIHTAHPTNRTKYMVLDNLNWDLVPMPLIQVEVFTQSSVIPDTGSDLPWDL